MDRLEGPDDIRARGGRRYGPRRGTRAHPERLAALTPIRLLSVHDADLLEHVAPGVFDGPLLPELVTEFLSDPRHHLAVAVDDGEIVGMASAVHYVHPDKPAELWINEVGVAPEQRGRGLGGRLVDALLDAGRTLGCREAWVLTEASNPAARALYVGRGGRPRDALLYSWSLAESSE